MIDILGKKYITEKEATTFYPYSEAWFRKKRLDKKKGLNCPPFIQMHKKGKIYYPVVALENWFRKKIAENE